MRRALPLALFALLVVLVYADPLLTGRMFSGRDLIAYNHPMEKAIHDAYARGRLPVWMADVSGGRPLAPNPNAGALYPLRPLLSLLPFSLATRLFPVLHWILAGLGAYLLTRRLGCSRSGAWIGAVTYAFSGVGVSQVFYPSTHPGVSLLPWIVWATVLEPARPAWRVAALSVLLGMDLLAGDIFTVALALSASLLWVLIGREVTGRSRRVFELAGALGLALLAAMPQVLATALWAPLTERGVTGLTVGNALELSLHPLRLLELVIPFPFGATWELDPATVWGGPILTTGLAGLFASLYAGALAPLGLFWLPDSSNARYARVLLLCGVVLSVFGVFVPAALSGLRSPLPLRHPEKFAVVISLALAILAALASDAGTSGRRWPRWALAVGLALAGLAVAAALDRDAVGRLAVALTGSAGGLVPVASRQVAAAVAEGGLLWTATVVALELLGRAGRWRGTVGLSLLTLVPVAADRPIARTFSEEAVLAPTVFAEILEKRDPLRQFRVFGSRGSRAGSAVGRENAGADPALLDGLRRGWLFFTPALWSEGTVFNVDFDRGDLSRLHSLRRLAGDRRKLPDPIPLFESLSIRWAIRFRDEPPLPGFVRAGGDGLQDWDEDLRALPDLRLAENWTETADATEAVAALEASSGRDLVLETGSKRPGRGDSGSVRVVEKSPERLHLDVDCRQAGWLFALRGFWPYRDVRIDGSPAEVVPAQLAFSAVAVPEGRHRVEWIERLPGWETSRWGPVLFVLIAGLVFARTRE
jgi:hypothetical protein